MRKFKNGLGAIETYLGRTLHGPLTPSSIVAHCNETTVLKAAVTDCKITTDNYWGVELMGIKADGHS